MIQVSRTLITRRTHLLQRVLLTTRQPSPSLSSQARISSTGSGVGSNHVQSRYFSVQTSSASSSSATTVNENFVKEAIKKMMLDRENQDDDSHNYSHFQQHPISDDELKSRFDSFQVRTVHK